MKTSPNLNISTWLYKAPIKFALLSFILIFVSMFIGQIIINAVEPSGITTQITMTSIPVISIILGIILMLRKMPRGALSRDAFVAIQNIQTFVLSIAYFALTYFVLSNSQEIKISLVSLMTKSPYLFLAITSVISIFLLYMTGLFIANIYAKFCRIQAFNIPIWKIILSIPFGFSALWVPGYIASTPNQKNIPFASPNAWYARLTNNIITSKRNIIISFILITLLSSTFFGFTAVLLTFSLALIYGIWTLQVGEKQFIKNMNKRYATTAVIINLIIILVLTVFGSILSKTQPDVEINISDTSITAPYDKQ